jgi:hypothetical protein
MEHEFNEVEPLMYGVHCPVCGGSLLKRGKRAYCDWCDENVKPEADAKESASFWDRRWGTQWGYTDGH